MNSQQFLDIVRRARERQDRILTTKGADYTRHEEDRLSNFKRSAQAIGLDPLQVWAIFVNKHLDAIMAFIKTGKAESEAIEGRFDDVINYMYLGEALLTEVQTTRRFRTVRTDNCAQRSIGGCCCSLDRGHNGLHKAYEDHDQSTCCLEEWV